MDAFLTVGLDEIELVVKYGPREVQSGVFFCVSNSRTFARQQLRDWGYVPDGRWLKHDESTWQVRVLAREYR
ncbi:MULTISPECIES: hypothetical protein [unclassified Saccharopolyspora]|uniref:hypothetical protein n=1 Tax=unclassified Saccharopolyspora TaxID=2646250 RepID=UPI001CD23848|nr:MULTISPECIES: hypothetical protein [unclassified Saccharopolyspora]MCA1185758.1 hypothetical protein [Saccharopolyspora sp. 6T]MCA1191670.1 hypothetical protein [Saccharopolyspora sp. 6V]